MAWYDYDKDREVPKEVSHAMLDLIDRIQYAYLKTDGTYGDLASGVSDKVKYIEKLLHESMEVDKELNKFGLREYSFKIGPMDDSDITVAIVGEEYSSVDDDEKFYRKEDVDTIIAGLQSKVTLASLADDCNNLRNKRCNYCSALKLQKDKTDKLFSGLKCLVMRDLIKDCPEKASVVELVKEWK